MTSEIQALREALGGAHTLAEQLDNLQYIDTGSYALNRVISGDYHGGIPIGGITQFTGESSVGKTTFLTSIIIEAQRKGYITILLDTEYALSKEFAVKVGIDPKKLIYCSPEEIETVEMCFETIERYIKKIREVDKTTPILIGYDSLAVSPTVKEVESTDYLSDNMIGAHRAKITGAGFRKLNPFLRKNNVALVVINQNRSKVGVMYGDPTTDAAGGKSLKYYLMVNMKATSGKTAGKLKDENGKIIGIKGKLVNTKNKVGIPFLECEFELHFDIGLNQYAGLVDCLLEDGVISRGGAWYTVKENGFKFQNKDFTNLITDREAVNFDGIRSLLGI